MFGRSRSKTVWLNTEVSVQHAEPIYIDPIPGGPWVDVTVDYNFKVSSWLIGHPQLRIQLHERLDEILDALERKVS